MVFANLAYGSGAVRIDERVGRSYVHGLIERRQLELNCVFRRNGNANLERLRHGREARLLDLELVNAVREALNGQGSLLVCRERTAILIRRARDLNGRLYAEPGGIGHLEV